MYIIQTAADLISDHVGDNIEYDKAIVEMTANLIGCGNSESYDQVESLIRTNRDLRHGWDGRSEGYGSCGVLGCTDCV